MFIKEQPIFKDDNMFIKEQTQIEGIIKTIVVSSGTTTGDHKKYNSFAFNIVQDNDIKRCLLFVTNVTQRDIAKSFNVGDRVVVLSNMVYKYNSKSTYIIKAMGVA